MATLKVFTSAIDWKDITPTQYAKIKGCSLQNVTKSIREGRSLKHDVEIENFNRLDVRTGPSTLN